MLSTADGEDGSDLKRYRGTCQGDIIHPATVGDGRATGIQGARLAFNRILTGCPFQVPLPKTLKLADYEIMTIESMIIGIKNNCEKFKNISAKGFQLNFIERPGRLEQREDKWVLYVEGRSYDMLLDFLPWSYRFVQLPWLEKRINVVWRDKGELIF